jgi:hypothetical protein
MMTVVAQQEPEQTDRALERGQKFRSPEAWHMVLRIGAALLGGYAFTWGFSVLGIAAGVAAGVPYDEANTGMMLLAFLVYLGAFLWAFAGKRLALIWAVLLGGGAAMTGAAWLWQRALLS